LSIADGVAVPDESRPMHFPLVGKIAAGYPIEKVEDHDELDLLDIVGPRPGRPGAIFALRVTGESMRDEGILDGDYILVERTDVAANGDRVVALLPNGETTLKTFFREADRVRLQPANPEFKPIYVKDCRIQGIVRSVLRKY
jgi:repressor LexA